MTAGSIQHWLNKPYPLLENSKDKLLIAIGFGLFTYFFLLIYEPFQVSGIQLKPALYLAGFGVAVFSGMAISYFLFPIGFHRWFNPEKWQVKRELFSLTGTFFLIALLNYSYNSLLGPEIAPQVSFGAFVGKTFAVGIFPLILLIFWTERRLKSRNEQKAEVLNYQLKSDSDKVQKDKTLQITPETIKSPPFQLELDRFLFARSDNNYTTFYYLENGSWQKELVRISIKNANEQLSDIDEVVRCHRSFLINKLKIKSVSGNARSMNVTLVDYDQPIPISRTFTKEQLLH